jgi:signal transduction histidine kinase
MENHTGVRSAGFDATALSALFDRSPIPTLIYDQETFAVRAVNDAAVAIYGRSREELTNQAIFSLLRAEDSGAGSVPPCDEFEGWGRAQYTKSDDETVLLEYSCRPLVYEARPARLIFLTRCEEELRLKSRVLEDENRRMQEANRTKSEFLANMGHELRTPLNAVIGFAELMFKGKVGAVSERHKEYLGDILTSSRRLLQLINDVLDLAKVESGKLEFQPETLDLAKAINEVRDILRGLAATKRLRVETEVEPEVATVTLDPSKLKQILYNYLSNALKFTPEGGSIQVRALSEGEHQVRIEVRDTGVGVRRDDLARLFVEFQQLDSGTARNYAGTGLGLALTRRIVEAQGGQVGVESELGKGSLFWAVLPKRAEAVVRGDAPQADPRAGPKPSPEA